MKIKIYLPIILLLINFHFSGNAQNMGLAFDGINDYVEIGTPSGITALGQASFTFEAWVNTTTVNTRQCIVGNWDYSSHSIVLELHSSGNLRLYVDATAYNSTAEVDDGKWHHVAGVRDITNNKIIMYVDGIEVYNQNATTTSFTITNPTRIGRNFNDSFALYFKGDLDEVRLWNDVRTEAEIRANMYKELTGNETNLIAYYKLNETSGTTASDSQSSGNYDGTLSNMTGNEWFPSPAFFGPKNCLDFDGNNDEVISSNIGSISGKTISAWVKLANTTQQAGGLVSIERSDGAVFDAIVYNETGNGWGFGSDGFNRTSWSNITETSTDWIHLAATYSNNDYKLYRNGLLICTHTSDAVYSFPSNTRVLIGHRHTGAGGTPFLNAQIDEVQVWDVVKTADEIREGMFKTLEGDEDDLVAYYNFDNTSGTTLQDFSSNDNDGTLTNMTGTYWVASTAFNTWLNTNSTAWTTAANWSRGSVPISTDNVGVYNYNTDPYSTGTINAHHFYLGSGINFTNFGNLDISGNTFLNSSITLVGGKTMDVDGSLVLGGSSKTSNLVLLTGASLITNGSVSGEATVNRTVSDGVWHFVSSPISDATANIFFGDYLQYFQESDNKYYDISDETTPLNIMQGYGWRNFGKSTTYSFTGSLNTGDQSIATTHNLQYGWNLVGNPYPSSLDWNILDGTYGTIHYWNSATGQDATYNNGASTNGGTGEYLPEYEYLHDASKILSSESSIAQLYAISNNDQLCIDRRPACNSIDLGFICGLSGTYQIGIVEMSDMNTLILEDLETNTKHDLLKSGNYSFVYEAGEAAERFIIHFRATGIEEIDKISQIFAYEKTVYIRSSEKLNNAQISIIDMMGRVVYESRLVDGQNEQITAPVKDGVYMVQLISEEGTQVEKVILK
ncbi:MAG: hypothetical protein B7C24_11045 [Bacteroidetes bacterium 4572_77]|nr:MAG: hypothetical protein B7C24_11045 [Bacteroidetes bacterium 4572_77]